MSVLFDTPIQFLKGVGPKLGALLEKRGVATVGQLLEWYPRTYEDRRAARAIATLQPEDRVSLLATVLEVRTVPLGASGHRKMYEVLIGDNTGRIACKFFRVPYKGYFQRFQAYQKVRVVGKVTHYRGRLEFHHPDLHHFDPEEETADALIPIYTETEGLASNKLRKMIDMAFAAINAPPSKEKKVDTSMYTRPNQRSSKWIAPPAAERGIPDMFPAWLLKKYDLLTRAQALQEIHQPPAQSSDEYMAFRSPAQRRVIFEELFWLELHLALRRSHIEREAAKAMGKESPRTEKLVASLPFSLTAAQKRSFVEILEDLRKPHPMHRLVQGDVGSGKTMVAFMAAVHAADNQAQSSIMVPTEILAEQHFKNATRLLEPLGLRLALLTGSVKASERRAILEGLQNGEIDFVVGTHALIQDDVQFHNLGLVIIDEQHRFGVDQRTKLKQKGLAPHFLVMTATPIPRTLAMTVYGDLDVSIIDELPPGRSPIVTRKTFNNKRPQVLGFMRDQIAKGRQAYFVYPLVEESEKIDLKNAIHEYEELKNLYPDIRFGLLHGKMKAAEKDQVMRDFRDHKIQVLVSTTVIEVGVDVPNANLMIIEHAERFGLSQLHQLRGRVGRGEHKSYCVLLLGYAVSDESRQRAEIMEQTTDGFKIAEADLELRGPGVFLGTRQSGLSGFKLANLARDAKILQEARQAAFELVRQDPFFASHDHQKIKLKLQIQTESAVG